MQDTKYSQTAIHILDNCYLIANSKNFYEDESMIKNIAKNTLSMLEKYLQEKNIEYPKNYTIKCTNFSIMTVYGRVLHYDDLLTILKDFENMSQFDDTKDRINANLDRLKIAKNKLIETYLQFKSFVRNIKKK